MYIPEARFAGPMPQAEPYFSISNRFWRRPENWQDISESIRWAARDSLPLELNGPPFLVANLVTQPWRKRLILHLVNYNAAKMPSLGPLTASIHLPEGAKLKEARLLSPDNANPEVLEFVTKDSAISINIRAMKTYSLVVLSW